MMPGKFWPKLNLVLCWTLGMLLIAELGLRGFYAAMNLLMPPKQYISEDWGWKTTPDLVQDYVKPGYGAVHYTTRQDGFRVYGNPDTKTIRMLVIGDSFTQATQVSDGKTYFDYLAARRPDLAVFAYGCGGYGTLQEYLVLAHHLETIRPDIVLWQFSGNDLINNDFQLEARSRSNNNYMVRPYDEAGRIVRRYPALQGGILIQHSYLLRHGLMIVNGLLAKKRGSIEDSLHPDHPAVQRTIRTTEALLNRVVRKAGKTPVIMFPVVFKRYEKQAFAEICARVKGLTCVPQVTERLETAEKRGQVINGGANDTHWNETGHALAGQTILAFLEASGLIPRRAVLQTDKKPAEDSGASLGNYP